MDRLEMTIGKHIREVRLEKRLSQEALSEMCGFSNTTLSSYENGRKNPSLQTIAMIAKKLGVSIERLYYGDENNSFIVSESDEGKKIVNSVYYLWRAGVIYYDDNSINGSFLHGVNINDDYCGFSLQLVKYQMPIKRLISSLNEYQRNQKTYQEPEKYLEMILSSVANEINDEIEAEEGLNHKR